MTAVSGGTQSIEPLKCGISETIVANYWVHSVGASSISGPYAFVVSTLLSPIATSFERFCMPEETAEESYLYKGLRCFLSPMKWAVKDADFGLSAFQK
ncbi:hypothetical protein [Parashewanella tropica]|uniref:hypothetical protein n=1 Tax=Parashewanella tropica TaxID=2547970 RepID=UPI00105A3697|nr:hypothetical protein [Parashewanella tropica]